MNDKAVKIILKGGLLLVILLISGYSWHGVFSPDPNLGEKIYKRHCAACHGSDGGNLQGQRSLQESTMDKDKIKKVTREGKGRMRGFEDQLSVEELEAVTAYVKDFQEDENFTQQPMPSGTYGIIEIE